MSKFKVLDLFSGIGGFSLGLERTQGFETVAFCEIEPYARRVLAKHWPHVPCYDDVRTLTAERLAADGISVDVICGGFPCQDISGAGLQAGLEGTRSGLWSEQFRLISEIRPIVAVVENVADLLSGERGAWFCRVLGDLASIGYDAEWHCISASSVGASHVRDRVWIIAYPSSSRWEGLIADFRIFERAITPFAVHRNATPFDWLTMVLGESDLRSGNGISVAVERDRLKALGNAVVPQIPEMIGRAIMRAANESAAQQRDTAGHRDATLRETPADDVTANTSSAAFSGGEC